MHVLIRIGLLALLAVSATQTTWAASEPKEPTSDTAKPSFDCATARNAIEELVCRDPELAELDVRLASVFESALKKVEAMPNTAPEIRHMKAYQLRWSRERNECARSKDAKECTAESYRYRIADLQARFFLVSSKSPSVYMCRDNPKNELIVTYVESDPATVRLDHAGKTVITFKDDEGDGKRFVNPQGVSFEVEGDMALVTWPRGNEFECIQRK
ncbi:MliC family protein [Rhizobium sp. C4]|uniref:MliC family protein n=1 Tax=Rhizobium sp. C4 TaxID=1349800 RepID=UPI001E3BFA99|nr:MliC family protein [Rhizobium sp. C4]MCD2175923.1 MliC family protein [Rhizobium sp. C4]